MSRAMGLDTRLRSDANGKRVAWVNSDNENLITTFKDGLMQVVYIGDKVLEGDDWYLQEKKKPGEEGCPRSRRVLTRAECHYSEKKMEDILKQAQESA